MSDTQSQIICREWLTQLGQQDTYIGRHDQTPLIDQNLQELAEGLQRLEKDMGSRLLRLMEEVRSDFAKQTQIIEEAITNIEAAFAQLEQSPHKAITNKRLSYALDQQVNLLSRRLRPRMLRALEKLSPKYKTVEKPLLELNSFRLHTTKPLADHLWLMRVRKPRGTVKPGISIFELEFKPRLNRLCRWPFISALKFSALRLRCQLRYAFYRLPFKAIATECLIAGSDITPARLVQRHLATHEELQNRLADAWRSLRYNLETASTELDDISDSLRSGRREEIGERPLELRTMVFDALSACLETMDDVAVIYASFIEAIAAEIAQDHANALTDIKQGIRDSRTLKARVRWALRSRKKAWRKWLDGIQESTKNDLTAIKEFSAKWGARALWLNWLSNIFRTQQLMEESLLQLTDLPTEAELLEQCKSLPPIYRRLFQNEPLTNREFLVGMEDELKLLAETYERWRSGRASSVAIIGPEGSGKTSLLNCFENELEEDVKVMRAEITHRMLTSADVINMLEDVLQIQEPSDSAAELINKILRMDRQIIILEHGHQLFLRIVGARQALETFFYIMMNTRSHVFWLVSFRLLPWIRMGYLSNIERFFTHSVKSEFHSVQDLVAALKLRQRATGQDPAYSEVGVDSSRVRKLLLQYRVQDAPVQQALEDIYFNNLYVISGGNMESALYYWLRSLSVDEQGKVSVQPCVKVDSSFVKKQDTLNLFTLAEVLAHGGLTPKEHGEIFNLDVFRSRLILDYLRQIRLLQGHSKDKHGQPQFYSINPLFYEQVHSVLDSMHIIY
ncbi:MAG: ATP-binding protein [Gammaproteobacteria bacterium]|nr:ATP-binding protein [Gammaproteobacteria bacterium]